MTEVLTVSLTRAVSNIRGSDRLTLKDDRTEMLIEGSKRFRWCYRGTGQ